MGWDFAAVVKYDGQKSTLDDFVDSLGSAERPVPFQLVTQCWNKHNYDKLDRICPIPMWVKVNDVYTRVDEQPHLPNPDVQLGIPEGFFFSFGIDYVAVSHLLRWRQFVASLDWIQVMQASLQFVCAQLDSTKCIITNDCNPVFYLTQRGVHEYESLLKISTEKGSRERDYNLLGQTGYINRLSEDETARFDYFVADF